MPVAFQYCFFFLLLRFQNLDKVIKDSRPLVTEYLLHVQIQRPFKNEIISLFWYNIRPRVSEHCAGQDDQNNNLNWFSLG